MTRTDELSKNAKLRERAEAVIPWGTQTNAKRPVGPLAGVLPAFIERGQGCRIVDPDGRECT